VGGFERELFALSYAKAKVVTKKNKAMWPPGLESRKG